MLLQRNRTAGDLARAELSELAREWNVQPLSADEERSYTTVLSAHNPVDVHEAFCRIREGARTHQRRLIPMCYTIVQCVKDVYRERTAGKNWLVEVRGSDQPAKQREGTKV